MGLILLTSDAYKLAKLRRRQREVDIDERQQAYVDEKTLVAEKRLQMPETIDGTELLDTSMSWDYSTGWEERRLRFVKALRSARVPFRPSVRVRTPDGIQNVYEGDHVDLGFFERGDCCVRCCAWKSEDAKQHARDHVKLQSVTGTTPPDGVPLADLCGFCGNNLANQKYRTKAA